MDTAFSSRSLHPFSALIIALGISVFGLAAKAADLRVDPLDVDVYAVVGDLGPASRENGGLNANLGFVVGNYGVLVINSGPSRAIANALREAIRARTDRPVRWVVNLNSQSHYWFGNSVFEAEGAVTFAHPEAIRLMRETGGTQRETLQALLQDAFADTELSIPREHVSPATEIDTGSTRVRILHPGAAHTPGDLVVWLPERRIVFAGDVAFTERLPAVLPISSTKGWIEAFGKVEAFGARWVVPGHGEPTTIGRARLETYDYLVHLREEARKVMRGGGGPGEAAAASTSRAGRTRPISRPSQGAMRARSSSKSKGRSSEMKATRVAFVCLHGSAKSLIAAHYLNLAAATRGLPLHATSAGLEADLAVPSYVVEGLRAKGIDASGNIPVPLTGSHLAQAHRVIAFGCDPAAFLPAGLEAEQWADCPAVSEGFEPAWQYITRRVDALVAEATP